jgi:hypothetical protein
MTLREKEAFIAGFMATGEGYNGEYPGSNSNDPREEAKRQYEMWACDHDFGEWEFQREARHGNRERWVRECIDCPESEYEFRKVSE